MGRLNHLIMKNYFAITHPGHRSDAICADGLGNFGRDVPAGLVYFSGFYLTPAEKAEMIRRDMSGPTTGDEDMMLNGC